MKKVTIVTTTINSPTKATLKFCEIVQRHPNFDFVIIGDTKTPHEEYEELVNKYERITYLTPDLQDELYPELSDIIGWKTIQRRNIGFVYAYDNGCDVLATIDDDNIPYDNWGDEIYVGEEVTYNEYECAAEIFDPLSVTKDNYLWHRGYPIDFLSFRKDVDFCGKDKKKCLVQANLWDGDPDIDAMARLTFGPIVKYDIKEPYGSKQIAPFNSQNTFIAREAIPYYAVLPFTGRMDDIWGSYILQAHFPNSVIYDKATVFQDRNEQDLVTNLENEVIGYRNTLRFIMHEDNYESMLPEKTLKFWRAYRKHFENKK
jgi:hypothetical protein